MLDAELAGAAFEPLLLSASASVDRFTCLGCLDPMMVRLAVNGIGCFNAASLCGIRGAILKL